MVLSVFEFGKAQQKFDFVIVDEAHRLQIRHAMPTGGLFSSYSEISGRIADHFRGTDPSSLNQLHWAIALSRFRIFMVDPRQSVRTNDLPRSVIEDLVTPTEGRAVYKLSQQMRVHADGDYVSYIRGMLSNDPKPTPNHQELGGYDFRLYDDPETMYRDIMAKDDAHGLSRISAGYAWPWISKRSPGDDAPHDIEIDGFRLRWNRTAVDWISSPTSKHEAGSIHTLQGYDLNWAGVIIGPDIRFDPATGRVVFHAESHFDPTNLKRGGRSLDDIHQLVVSAYEVLLTRGVRGTYVYVWDPALREHLRPYFPVQR